MLTIQERQFDAAVAFWSACGFKKMGKSKFHVRAEKVPTMFRLNCLCIGRLWKELKAEF